MDARRGHLHRPHTADVAIEAWAAQPAELYEEAVAAFVELFAQTSPTTQAVPHTFTIGPGSAEELLVLLLEEVLVYLDSEGLVPVRTTVESLESGLLTGTFLLVPLDRDHVSGPAPKGISYEDLELSRSGELWRCRAIVDV